MKKPLLLIFLSILLLPASSMAQFIGPVMVKPGTPGISNGQMVIAEVTMPSQPAFRVSYASLVRNDTVHLSACYYSGPATATKTITDTFQIGALSHGSYTLKFTAFSSASSSQCDSLNFMSKTVNFTVSTSLGTKDSKATAEFLLFPNPAGEMVWVKGENLKSLVITDLLGRTIKSFKPGSEAEVKVNIGFLAKGVYFLEAQSKDGSFSRERFVKE